ncbi:MAG: 5'-nucleotidase C-terminal domain-containing protein [Flavobacteriia bacterium]|nr:5'-nucleotidase C-terminal domain-containing protein [Flavobacteriia bacterium]
MIWKFIFICGGAGLIACSTYKQSFISSELLPVSIATNLHVDSLIFPYRDSLAKEMDLIIASSTQNFGVSRPSISMNNWVADAIFENQIKQIHLKPVITLFNSGGIRATFLKGQITVGDIFRVMPFDNSIVWVQFPIQVKKEIEQFLSKGKSHPISGGIYTNGKLQIENLNEEDSVFWVITSDYLAQGNDGMTFFSLNNKIETTNKLMRDLLIDEAKKQKILIFDSINRMKF